MTAPPWTRRCVLQVPHLVPVGGAKHHMTILKRKVLHCTISLLASYRSPPVTYRGTHDDVPRPSVFHFPGPHSIPSSASRRSQVGTLLDAKLKHPHPHICLLPIPTGGKTSNRSRRLTVLQSKIQLTSHDSEEVYCVHECC